MSKLNKNIIKTILLLIIVGFIVFNYIDNIKIKTNPDEFYNKIDVIQNQIDSIRVVNESLDNKLEIVNDNINTIDDEIKLVDKNLNKINKKTNEKIDSINDYSFNELELFFTNRYGEYKKD